MLSGESVERSVILYASSNEYAVGPYSAIVQVLRDYGKVPIGFLAAKLGFPSDEMRKLLLELQREGVIERDGDHVSLTRRRGKAASFV